MHEKSRLAIATDLSNLPEADLNEYLVPILHPWFRNKVSSDGTARARRYNRYIDQAEHIFDYTDPESARVMVYPLSWQGLLKGSAGLDHYRTFYQKYKHLQIVLFYLSDTNEPIGLGGEIVFRTSLKRKSRGNLEFPMPGWSEDLLEENGLQLQARPKREKPKVGFVGFARPLKLDMLRRLKYAAQLLAFRCGVENGNVGAALRRNALMRLEGNSSIELEYEVKEGFVGGKGNQSRLLKDRTKFQEIRADFLQNMLDSDYTLCVRGLGNYSYRFYEIACCGRIPLFVDSDMVLPFEDQIDYQNMMPIIAASEINQIDQVLLKFHRSLTDDRFGEIQNLWRETWVNYLSPCGFFRNMARQLKSHSHSRGG